MKILLGIIGIVAFISTFLKIYVQGKILKSQSSLSFFEFTKTKEFMEEVLDFFTFWKVPKPARVYLYILYIVCAIVIIIKIMEGIPIVSV
jgi:hypothetical protein